VHGRAQGIAADLRNLVAIKDARGAAYAGLTLACLGAGCAYIFAPGAALCSPLPSAESESPTSYAFFESCLPSMAQQVASHF
jgi:hypothetical protein